jgi:diguanylate cyclase (GGDEF)-like protein
MKKWVIVAALCAGPFALGTAAQTAPASKPATLTTLKAVHQLTNEQAATGHPTDFEATVTFYRGYESTLFVEDGDTAIYVQPAKEYDLSPGDRVRVRGITRNSFRPFVDAATLTVLGHVRAVKPAAASYEDLIHAIDDCRMVSIRGKVLSADIVLSSDRPSTVLEILMDGGGEVEVEFESNQPDKLPGLLDSYVEVSGAVSGRFDGKMQMTGVVLHAQNLGYLTVLKPAASDPWTLPTTQMDEVFSGYAQTNLQRRLRVQGTVTYYMPGQEVVLENGKRSLWINTRSRTPLAIGDFVDATGFPDVHDGFLKLTDSEVRDSGVNHALHPTPATWLDLNQSHHVFDLVSTEGEVVAEVREAGQDEYVLRADGHLFSAIYRHPANSSLEPVQLPELREIPLGSKVRVAGICILEDPNPFNRYVPFDLLLRTYDDIAVVTRPSLLTVENLILVVGVLLLILLAISAWGWMMQRQARRQTAALARRIEVEAALERRSAQIEQRRSRILEAINSSRPLAHVLEEITDLVSFTLRGAPCWCEVVDGARLGDYVAAGLERRIAREEIPARTGPPLGVLCAAMEPGSTPAEEEKQALFLGTRLATLAIETHKAYADLVRRSEFDLLTDVHNRFSLDKQLHALIERAREMAGVFGLIYVDLDDFKQVNDVYGHQVGDLYLQDATARMKRQLRAGDLLARLGGDEFAVVIPAARGRADVEEVAHRLENCFHEPFNIGGHVLSGTASVGVAMYPDDGTTKDSLLSAADAAMYVSKHTRQEADGKSAQL